ncbi:MAG: hypothetical protein PHE30_00400 [Candidatus Omnitrophica bacterium]|nr:hypothetical protein [Candidatus Omnitrophota bacterium]MDD5027530.1 hypothetical protein [Candidatus Omnitrophota bacterium]MDD5661907.1 hypothetical protein [Candidatus Omnitrophota bacterium]
MLKWLAVVFILVCAAGCRPYIPPISAQTKDDLSRPIDCSRAREDIQALEQEKAEVAEQAKAGVKMFVPAAAARAILHGDYLDREKVASGEYNQDIDNKIQQIKEKCSI